MESNLNAYQIVGISLVIAGVLIEIIVSMISLWLPLNIENFRSTDDLIKEIVTLNLISKGGWGILYMGFFLLFWDIGKKMEMPESYTIIIVLIFVMVIATGLVVIGEYILGVAKINMSTTVYMLLHGSLLAFYWSAFLLTGIALFLLSQKS